tara:strand:- start:76 stop:1125 length:1050 start_codon:yes stop_codon:yes gene_type:complete
MENKKLALFGLLGVMLMFVAACQPASVTPTPTQPSGDEGATTVFCPSDVTTAGRVKYEDKLASTTTFSASPNVYFVSSSSDDITAGALSTSDFSTAVNLDCGTKYTPTAVTTQDNMASVVGSQLTASGPKVTQLLGGHKIRALQVKIKEKDSDKYMNVSSRHDYDGTYTGYTQIGVTSGTTTNVTDQPGQSSLTIAADGELDLKLQVKTNVTKAKYGEDGLNTLLCVDANSNKWDEPSVSIGGGALTDVFDDLKGDDDSALNGYEYCYNIGQITGTARTIDFFIQTAAGVNPGTSDRPLLRFVAEGRYQSNKDVDAQGDKAILVGAFQDDTGNTEVVTAEAQSILLLTS